MIQNIVITVRKGLSLCFFQDFVWAFGQVLAGVVTISLPIRYGASKFRNEIVNQVWMFGSNARI